MNSTRFQLALLATIALTAPARGSAGERRWNAEALDAQAVTADVRLTRDGAAFELARGELVEDDGPAAGFSYQPNEESLAKQIWLRKQLVVDDPRADRAILLIGSRGTLQFDINGSPRQLRQIKNAGSYWQAFELPSDVLKKGLNEFKMHGTGSVWIARDDEYSAGSRTRTRHPDRSAKSTDGGETWDDKRLGTAGNVDGEYYVRIFFDRYRRQGSLLLPVVDVGQDKGDVISPPLTSVGRVCVRTQANTQPDEKVTVWLRSGSTAVPVGEGWTDWRELGSDGVLEKPAGRYVQVRVLLQTNNPLSSPQLKEVVIQSEATRSSDWIAQLKIVEIHNQRIVRTSIPFEYEPCDHPRLKELRKQYRLDEVVAGASGEFDLIKRLAAWSATRWIKLGHLGEAYPPWDALEILKPHRDGTPIGGFCQQYNIVLLQACESFGLVGRGVSLGPGSFSDKIRSGHEAVEIWSNDFQKWVYIDGSYAWYIADAESDIPLSLMELRQRQLAAFREERHRPVRLERIADTGQAWEGLKSHPAFVELRLVPRSNFLQTKSPLPLNQGMRGWFWTGHHVWTDEQAPALPLYANRVSHLVNWEWTLNQARYTIEATENPGFVLVHLETETPDFATFLARIDGAEMTPVKSGFSWKLHHGANRLEVRARNRAGVLGAASWIVLNYQR